MRTEKRGLYLFRRDAGKAWGGEDLTTYTMEKHVRRFGLGEEISLTWASSF